MSRKLQSPRLFFSSLWRKGSTVALVAFFTALLCFFLFPLESRFDTHHIFFKGLLVITASIAYGLIWPLHVRALSWGWAFLLYSLWLDLVKEFTLVPEWWDIGMVGTLEILGLSLIALGFSHSSNLFVDQKSPIRPSLQPPPSSEILTHLRHRTLLQARLEQAMLETRRRGRQLALFFLDLDHFKEINDSLGHNVGDAELIRVEQVLHRCLKTTDTILRIGGDEFAIVRPHILNLDESLFLAQQILDRLSEPHRIHDHEIRIHASIGITLFPDDAHSAEQLLKNADIAMHHAKHSGRNNYQLYMPEMSTRARSRTALAKDLGEAFETGNLYLQFQPQIEISSGKTISFEALLRWRHPQHGFLTRQAFIRLAEETGLIVPIGAWVLETACRTCLSWQRLHSRPLHIAVNLSPRQFRQPRLAEHIAAILENTGLSPTQLEVEITEGLLLENMDSAIAILQSLSQLGVHISIDDFGTGYSSLAYLKRLPFDSIKIDRSFIQDIPNDCESQAITNAIISLGHNLDLKVVAEGVESLEQFLYLRDLGCDLAQGYFISRPLDKPKAEQWWKEEGKRGIFPFPGR